MEIYLKSLGTIALIYASIFNLSFFRIKVKEIISMAILSEAICCVLLYFKQNEFVLLIPMIVIPIVFLYKNSKNVVESIAIPLFSLVIAVVTTYVLASVCGYFFNLNINSITTSEEVYWTMMLFEFLQVFLVTKLLAIIIYRKTKIRELNFKGTIGFLVLLSLILVVVIFYSTIILNRNDNSTKFLEINNVLFLSYFILLIVIMYILIRSLTKELEFKNKQDQYENLQQYSNNLEQLYSDMRAFRHDYINILASMVGYIENNDMEGLTIHFNKKIIPLSAGMEKNNFKIVTLKNIKVPEIKGIFSSKLIRAQEIGIEVHIEITEPIENFNMDIIDLSRSVGILLDNAIEAATECDKPGVKVAIINDEKSVKIIIINSCPENTPPIHKIYQNGFSTKGSSRGIGLHNLKEMISKYKHASLDTIIENGEFKQLLYISKA